MSSDCVLLPLSQIRPTEEVCSNRVNEVVTMIMETRAWTHPICIEGTVGALLDGHHRFAAAGVLGLSRVPVHVFGYADVNLASWRQDVLPTRAEVLARALSGDLYPCKTTRHVFSARLIQPIPVSELIDRCSEMRASGDTPLGSVPLMPQPDAVDEHCKQVRRQG